MQKSKCRIESNNLHTALKKSSEKLDQRIIRGIVVKQFSEHQKEIVVLLHCHFENLSVLITISSLKTFTASSKHLLHRNAKKAI